jgi:hypothetical protein
VADNKQRGLMNRNTIDMFTFSMMLIVETLESNVGILPLALLFSTAFHLSSMLLCQDILLGVNLPLLRFQPFVFPGIPVLFSPF